MIAAPAGNWSLISPVSPGIQLAAFQSEVWKNSCAIGVRHGGEFFCIVGIDDDNQLSTRR